MDADAIIDRRRLRRKLGFWRTGTLLILLALVGAGVYWSMPNVSSKDHIARIEITGLIQEDDDLIKLIDDVAKSAAAKALVVTISSPGGTTYGGERIYKALLRVGETKPVVADVRTLAASAGYMIAASTDHIVAGESSIVGSIGVIFQYPQVQELLDKVGVSVEAIKSAPLKAEPSPFHDASPAAREMIRSLVLDSYDWFVDMVAERRDMERSRALALADGSIFTGRQGLANGLVDALGGEAEIRAYLEEQGIGAGLEIVEWKPSSRDQRGLLPWLAMLVFEGLSDTPAGLAEQFGKLGGGKLFLDGLLSVWQVGGNSTMKN